MSIESWCHPTISSPVVPFSSCLLSFPALWSFPTSQLFASGGETIGVSASASVLPMNIQDCFPWGWTDWISLQSKGLSKESSPTPQFKSISSSVLSFLYGPLSHPYMTTWKTIALTRWNHSCDHMDHSLILLNETMSHAVKDHPRWMGYGGEFWQNVLHWRKECLENPMNSMKRQKNCPRKEQKISRVERLLDSLHGDDSTDLLEAAVGLQCIMTTMYFFKVCGKIQKWGWHLGIHLQSWESVRDSQSYSMQRKKRNKRLQ